MTWTPICETCVPDPLLHQGVQYWSYTCEHGKAAVSAHDPPSSVSAGVQFVSTSAYRFLGFCLPGVLATE